MKTTDTPSVGQQYASFMQEIKERLAAIEEAAVLTMEHGRDRAYLHAEFAFMQLRLVCELIALASLWVHRAQGISKKLEGAWHADEIFKEPESINQMAFPRPCRLVITGEDKQFQPRTGAFMTRADLARIYGQCGNVLHRGALKLFIGRKPKNYDLDFVQQSVAAIRALLECHLVLVVDVGLSIIVNFGDAGSPVQVLTSQAEGAIAVELSTWDADAQ